MKALQSHILPLNSLFALPELPTRVMEKEGIPSPLE
jgi:hypothetical protein